MYVYQAARYCDECGNALRREVRHNAGSLDSDEFPQYADDDEEQDGPNHCESGADCLDPIDLSAFGLAENATLFGAESRKIGALVGTALTEDGVAYLQDLLAEIPNTPYQLAVKACWREVFADYLPATEEHDNA